MLYVNVKTGVCVEAETYRDLAKKVGVSRANARYFWVIEVVRKSYD